MWNTHSHDCLCGRVYGLANTIGQHTLRISLNDDVGANTLTDRVPSSCYPDTNPFVLRGGRRVLLSPIQYKHSTFDQVWSVSRFSILMLWNAVLVLERGCHAEENKVMSMQYDGVTSGCSTGIFTLRFFECLYAQ